MSASEHDQSPASLPADCQLISSFRDSEEPWSWYVRRRVRWRVWQCRKVIWKLKTLVKRMIGYPVRKPGPCLPTGTKAALPCKDLQPGDCVRVRSLEEIEHTLDANNRCHGCALLWPMRQYCGQEFRVIKRVERFFDENRWRMLKCKNVVLLEGVYCDGTGGHPDTRGCDRMCFYFWRTEWLERLSTS